MPDTTAKRYDYVILHPDATITNHVGYAGYNKALTCHGQGGQWLPRTKTGFGMDSQHLRIVCCDCSSSPSLLDEHPANPLADSIITALGHDQRAAIREFLGQDFGWRGPVALVRCGYDNEPAGMNEEDFAMFETHRAALAAAPGEGLTRPPNPFEPLASFASMPDGLSVVSLGEAGDVAMINLDPGGDAPPAFPLPFLIASALDGTIDDQITDHLADVAAVVEQRAAWGEVALIAAQRIVSACAFPMGGEGGRAYLAAQHRSTGGDPLPAGLELFHVLVADWLTGGESVAAAAVAALPAPARDRTGRLALWMLSDFAWRGSPAQTLDALGLTLDDLTKGRDDA